MSFRLATIFSSRGSDLRIPVCCSACQNLLESRIDIAELVLNLISPDIVSHIILPSHVDDLDLIPVGELNDLLVEVEEDILTLTLAVQ